MLHRGKVYYKIFCNGVATKLAYKWNIITGIFAQILQVLVSIFVWKAIYEDRQTVQGYTLSSIVTYLIFASLISIIFSSSHFFYLPKLVKKGNLNMYLVRPYNFLVDNLAIFLSSKLVDITSTFVFLGLIAFAAGIKFDLFLNFYTMVLLFANLILIFLFGSTIGTISFWIIEMWPVKPLYSSLMAMFGGTIFPLDLLPKWLYSTIQYTPFSLFGYVNVKAIQGGFSNAELLNFTCFSVIWSLICYLLYNWLWKNGLKRYEAVNT